VARLDQAGRIEMRIVAAGARRDMGQLDAALVTLQCPELSQSDTVWGPRLRYAYADTLVELGRIDEAAHWFDKTAQVDIDSTTDAEDRFVELLSSGASDTRDSSTPPPAPPSDEVTFMDLGE